MTTIVTNFGNFGNLYSLYTEMRLNKITEVEILEYSYCCDNMKILCGKWSYEDIERAYLGK